MNEPLNTSLTSINFSGKSCNNHPFWRNIPLRLTPEQTENPNVVLTDFFQSYHLNDVRETLWQWITEVVSSPNNHANDHHERNNYMFFYEKVESLVEAAWVMNQGDRKSSNPARQTLEKANMKVVVEDAQPSRYCKPTRLIEKAQSHPEEVIAEVFNQVTLLDLTEDLLPNWLQAAVINTQSPYSSGNGRKALYGFYEELLPLVEALYEISENRQKMKSTYLTEVQQNPLETINQFFQQFSIDYIRRELCDFLEAGIGSNGHYPDGFTPWLAWMSYNHLLCLTEAAYQLYINQQMQSVTIRLYSPRNQ